MKILRLRFMNLNSLRGEWSIDFTAPPLSEAGLFAITGPTGAGKTTVLDAITLALYGRAARYGVVANPEQMMSRHTGFCSAEVEFSCVSGVYRSVWQLRRARHHWGGNLQSAERRVISLPDEQVLTQRIDDSNRKIEELTSLNYERFLRSVMLVQGDFAAFLKAKPNERTELLEQITGSGIYSRISISAYRYAEAARAELEVVRARHANLRMLQPEARAEREAERTALMARLAEIRNEMEALRNRIDSAKSFLKCAEELVKIESEAARIAQERNSASAELGALDLYEKAGPFVARLTARDLLGKQHEEEERKLSAFRLALPALVDSSAAEKGKAEAARQCLEEAERQAETLKPLWGEVTKLDGEIAVKRNTLAHQTEAREKAEDEHRKLREMLDAKEDELAKNRTALLELSEWRQKHSGDAGIANALPDLQMTYARWSDHSAQWNGIRKEVAALEETIEGSARTLANAETLAARLSADWRDKETRTGQLRGGLETLLESRTIEDWEKERDAAQTRLGLLTELQTLAGEIAADNARHIELLASSKSHLEKEQSLVKEVALRNDQFRAATELVTAWRKNVELIRLVQSLEQHRHELVEGHECPLCGSKEHPYASPENAPSSSLTSATDELKTAEKEGDKIHRELAALGQQQAANATERKRAVDDLKATADRIGRREKEWVSKVEGLGIILTSKQLMELETLMASEVQRHAKLRQRVEDLRALGEKFRTAERISESAKVAWKEKSAECDKLASLLKQTKESLGQATGRAEGSLASVNAARVAFIQMAGAFKMEVADLGGAELAVTQLRKRSEEFGAKTAAGATMQGTVKALEATIAEVQRQFKSDGERIVILRQEEKKDRETLQAVMAARKEKFADKVISAEQSRVAAIIKECRRASEAANVLLSKVLQEETACKTNMEALAKGMEERGARLVDQTAALEVDANGAGFANLESLRKAILLAPRAKELAALRTRLSSSDQALVGRRAATAAAQADLPAATKDDAPLVDTITTQRSALEGERGTREQKLGALLEELRQDDESQKNRVELSEQIGKAEVEFRRWAQLSKLIGSATGNVFARFAQGLTLERLVAVANRHLVQLSPRYAMRRSNAAADDLELEIIDHYQGDVVRPMRSLSGGESFLASLALAVGLSELASGRTAIESLFIDEGFGSLDPATLEVAMTALEGLRTNGKTIGIISHVDAMKERIATQIQVHKREGGRSELEVKS